MVDDDGVSMSADKAMETSELVVDCGENSRLVVVEYDVEGGEGGALARERSVWRRGLEGLS